MSVATRMKPFLNRPVFAVALLALLLAGAVLSRLASADDTAGYPAASLNAPSDPAALIARGKYLVDAADCMPCHTGPGHAPFTGGLVLNTPYGGLPSPNITPDKSTGIGTWTDADFYNALHYGESPGHSYLVFPKYLYPAMPFTSYAKLSYADVMAIKAYIFSLPPQSVAPTASTMRFPFSQRPVLLGWRILFFNSSPLTFDPSWSPQIQNGAYLTEALGHCGECHTPRNIMGAVINSESLAGAHIDAYYAPNISSDKTFGVGGWSQDDLVSYLYAGGNKSKGSAFGPMGEVVQYSLSQLPKSDTQDIAAYLQTITPPRTTPPEQGPAAAMDTAQNLGAHVYAANCQGCHQPAGHGLLTMIPGLAGNESVTATDPTNVIGAVLNGLGPWNHGPAMPSFATSLSDEEIAAVTNYVRTAWGNPGTANATPADVMGARQMAIVPAMADMASDQFGCPHVSNAGGMDSLPNPGSNLLDVFDGATPDTLPNRTRVLVAALKAADATITPTAITNDLVAAYCPVVAHQSGLTHAQKIAMLQNFVAGAQPLITGPN